MLDHFILAYTITNKIVGLVSIISEMVGSIGTWENNGVNPQLRRDKRVKTIYVPLAIENNSLSFDQVTATINDKRIHAAPCANQEMKLLSKLTNISCPSFHIPCWIYKSA